MRLTKIYTRTGDQGSTRLGEGTEVPKDHTRVTAYGEIDELCSQLGLTIACKPDHKIIDTLESVQHNLFNVGGELAAPGLVSDSATPEMIAELEVVIDDLNAQLSPLEEFILPGGTIAAANLHLSRAICRRAERSIVTLSHSEQVAPELIAWVNRLSDLLFVMARFENQQAGNQEIYWKNPRKL